MIIARWLWHVWRGNRLQAILNALIGLADVAVSLMSVWAVKHAIDVASGATSGSVYRAVGLMGGLILIEFALGIAQTWVKNILGVRAQNAMQQALTARLLRSKWRGREAMHSGDIINRLEQDVRQVIDFLTETLPSTLSTVALFVGAFIYLWQMDARLALVTVGIMPVFLLLSKLYVGRMRKLTRNVRHTDSAIQGILTETMQHRMLVKAMEADVQMLGKLSAAQRLLRHQVKRRTLFRVWSRLAVNTGFSLGYLIAFLWGALRLSAGTLTFGGMAAFLQLVNRIQGPARDLTKLAPAFVAVLTAAERLMELERLPEEEQGEKLPIDGPCGVRFEGVSYRYQDEEAGMVLNNVSFNFAPATITAILGPTGSGKTTLVRLLLGLVSPQSGTLSIYNNRGDEAVLCPRHRCNFVYVPQGNTLLSGTLRDNLRLGRADATDEEMVEALKMACADFVFDLPHGLDTEFAEQGGGMSEGQAQRIAIARALLGKGSVMLLDEATSALDPATERRLLENLLVGKRRTVVFVTHREAVTDYCDHTISI